MQSTQSPFFSSLSYMHAKFDPLVENKAAGRAMKWNYDMFEEKPAEQQGLESVSLRDPVRTRAVIENHLKWKTTAQIPMDEDLVTKWGDRVEVINSYKDSIQHHVQQRVALFFQQCLLCHKTPFHFKIASTEGQLLTAPTLKLVSTGEDKEKLEIPFQAAHSSTIPSLKACNRADFLAGKEVSYFGYLVRTFMEMFHNSTVAAPVEVNNVDTAIDGKEAQDHLRDKAIALLNKTAKGKISPNQATRLFLVDFKEELQRCNPCGVNIPAKKRVIEIYLETVEDIIEIASIPDDVADVHPFFDPLMGINLSHDKPEVIPALRKILVENKTNIVKESAFTEAKIGRYIKKKFPEIKTLSSLHKFKLALTYNTRNTKLRQVLEKLFCISIEGIEKDQKLTSKLKKVFVDDKARFNAAYIKISKYVQHFQALENAYKSRVLKDIRNKITGYSQETVGRKMVAACNRRIIEERKKDTPDKDYISRLYYAPCSRPTVYRLENDKIHYDQSQYATPPEQRHRNVDNLILSVISEALGVSETHVLEPLFASSNR